MLIKKMKSNYVNIVVVFVDGISIVLISGDIICRIIKITYRNKCIRHEKEYLCPSRSSISE